jgi:predicted RNA-binding protein Jag
MPNIGTSNKKTNDIKKIIIEYLKSLFWSMDEKIKITVIPNIIKNRCLKKNE